MTALKNPRDIRLVLDAITQELVEQADMTVSIIWLYTTDDRCPTCLAEGRSGLDGGQPGIHACAQSGLQDEDAKRRHHRMPAGYGLPGRVMVSRRPMLIRNADQVLQRYRADRASAPELGGDGGEPDSELQWAHELGIRSAVAFPLIVQGDELVGVLGSLTRRDIDDEEFAHLGILAQQAAMSIKSAQIFEENRQLRDRLLVENAYLQEEIRTEAGFSEIVGDSRALRALLQEIRQVAITDSTVLLLGETGTGKELIARAIHQLSPRRERPLIKVNCGAIAPGLVESELFGHERGAFTGALQRRIGRFELANNGTLFLDEIGELPPESQTRLLRVLQEQEFERVGGNHPIRVDVRLIAATNRDLEAEVAAGRFRPDLFYRLNVFPARVPPLRERKDDIPTLVNHFVAHQRRRLGKSIEGVSREGMERLRRYSWPGNIRELQNVIERACVLAGGPVLSVPDALADGPAHQGATDRILTLAEAEKHHIRRALDAAGGTINGAGGAAVMLGINPNTLRSRMEKLGLLQRRR
ncbi:MAG TPA: sigma 54-interacting transcriptional regulator [Gemmatimonadales bacterium]|nr:sigma 54-interacting transcriptional regulator [Gemmatimonadales bacterium]